MCVHFSTFIALLNLVHESHIILSECINDGIKFSAALFLGTLLTGREDTVSFLTWLHGG